MNNSIGKRLAVAGVLLVMMMSLMEIEFLGAAWHERIGLAVGLLVIIHLWLARKQLVTLLKGCLRKKTPWKMRCQALVDVLLCIILVAILVSGVGSSVTLLTNVQLPDPVFAVHFHQEISYGMMLLSLVHLWQHKGWVKGAWRMVKRKFSSVDKK